MTKIFHVSTFLFILTWSFNVLSAQSLPYPDRHSTNLSDGWLSCEPAANPNSTRGISHWIMYDFGHVYKLYNSTFWNFNTPERINSFDNRPYSKTPLPGELSDGLQDIVIDMSVDGKTWTEFGYFTLKQAPGSSFYEGDTGPDFKEATARYLLITAIRNYGGKCYGLSEVIVNAEPLVTQTSETIVDKGMKIYPNPFRDRTNLYLYDFAQDDALIQVVDIVGNIVHSQTKSIRNNIESIEINGTNMPSGLYIIKVIQSTRTRSIKMEIIK